MRVLLLRSLRERFRRPVLTSLAVVIGVALISGTLIFTDTISRSFDEIGEVSYRGVAVAVTPLSARLARVPYASICSA